MRKKIKARLEKIRIETEFQIYLIPRRRRYRAPNPDYIKETLRDEIGNHLDKDGNIILTQIRTESGKTLTPSEQYRQSKFSPKGKSI